MLRNFVYAGIVFFTLSIFSLSARLVTAQTPTPNPISNLFQGTSDIPGVTCGDATNPLGGNRCCSTAQAQSEPERPDFACLSIPVPFADDPKVCLSDLVWGVADMLMGAFKLDSLDSAKQSANAALNPCTNGVPQGTPGTPACKCIERTGNSSVLCDRYLKTTSEYGSCVSCATGNGVWTGLGCMKTGNVSTFISSTVFTFGFGLAGSMAMLCILYATFILQTSRGNPEKIKKARENLRACITGLLLIIFSVFFLRLIGVSILRIPGFN